MKNSIILLFVSALLSSGSAFAKNKKGPPQYDCSFGYFLDGKPHDDVAIDLQVGANPVVIKIGETETSVSISAKLIYIQGTQDLVGTSYDIELNSDTAEANNNNLASAGILSGKYGEFLNFGVTYGHGAYYVNCNQVKKKKKFLGLF